MAFKNGKLLAILALATSATTLGLSIQPAHADGEGGLSGSASFQSATSPTINLGAVSGAIGRIHGITNATIDGSSVQSAAAFGVGSAGGLSFTASGGELSEFSATSTDIDGTLSNLTSSLSFPIGLTASTGGLNLTGS